MADEQKNCAQCGRPLPKRAFRTLCATCVKQGQGKTSTWAMNPKPARKK
jgi:hypothetical protein